MSNGTEIKLVIGDEVVWSMKLRKPLEYHVGHLHGRVWATWPATDPIVYAIGDTREEALDRLIGNIRVLWQRHIVQNWPPSNARERRAVELLKEQFEPPPEEAVRA